MTATMTTTSTQNVFFNGRSSRRWREEPNIFLQSSW